MFARTGSAAEVASWLEPCPPALGNGAYAAFRVQAVAADADELRASCWAGLLTTTTRCGSCPLTSSTPVKVPSRYGSWRACGCMTRPIGAG